MVAIAGRGWSLAPSLRAMFDEADRRWPKRSRISDGSVGDLSHQARASDHNPDASGDVLAGDLTHDPANGCDARLFAEHLRTSRDPRVKYVISAGKMFASYSTSSRPAWTWGPYTGLNAHEKHTHVSVLDTPAAKNDLAPWFPYADAPDPKQPTPRPVPADQEDDMPISLIQFQQHPDPDYRGVVWKSDGFSRWPISVDSDHLTYFKSLWGEIQLVDKQQFDSLVPMDEVVVAARKILG